MPKKEKNRGNSIGGKVSNTIGRGLYQGKELRILGSQILPNDYLVHAYIGNLDPVITSYTVLGPAGGGNFNVEIPGLLTTQPIVIQRHATELFKP